MTSIRTTFADAIRRVNAAYRQLPDPDSYDLFTPELVQLEAELETAWAAGDEPATRRAINAWETGHLEAFRKAGR